MAYMFNKITVRPQLPKNINKLYDIAYNVWWSWNTEYLKLFKEIDIDLFTTTTTAEPPSLTETYVYFRSNMDAGYVSEAEKFHAYNTKRGWDCLPNWKATADLWIARIDEKG